MAGMSPSTLHLLLLPLLLLPSTSSWPIISIPPEGGVTSTVYAPHGANVSLVCDYDGDEIQLLRFERTSGHRETLVRYFYQSNETEWNGGVSPDMFLTARPSPMTLTLVDVKDRHYGTYQCNVMDKYFNQAYGVFRVVRGVPPRVSMDEDDDVEK